MRVAAAWAPRAGKPAEDLDYRFAVVRSSSTAPCLLVERFDLRPLALYLRHLARWHLEGDAANTSARRVQTLLDRSARAGSGGRGVSTLLVDNYDSYTYNVFHLLAASTARHNDEISWKALSSQDFDGMVLSPGPGRPQRWHDFGVCAVLRHSEIPVLGICLGHRASAT